MKTCTTGISISAESRIAPRAKSEKIRKVDQNGRTLDSARPFATAAPANSRTPRCRLRPPGSSGPKSPAPSKTRRVLVEGARSADPPTSHGTRGAIALSTLPEESRLASPLASAGNSGSSASQPSGRRPVLHAVELLGELRVLGAVAFERRHPLVAGATSAGADAVGEVVVDLVRHVELGVLGPAVEALGRADVVGAERFAVRGGGALLAGPVPDVAVDDDERGSAGLGSEGVERARQHGEVVGVADAGDVPAESDEAGGDVLGEGQRGVALDGDLVVVVDPAQVGQAQVPGKRRGLRGDAFHQVTVAAEGVDVVVEQVVAGPVEVRGLPAGGDGHADRGGGPGAEGAGGGFDAGGPAVLGVSGAFGVELAEPFEVVEGDRRLAEGLVGRVHRGDPGQVQQRVQQGGRVSGGEDEAVAVGPDRIGRVEPEEPLPQGVGDRCHRHRGAGVARVGRLHGVHAQRADGGDGEVVEVGGVGRRGHSLVEHGHGRASWAGRLACMAAATESSSSSQDAWNFVTPSVSRAATTSS